MKKIVAISCIVIYMMTSQFITKARATTARENFAVDEDCKMLLQTETNCPHTHEKLDTFKSKKTCRGKTYGELQAIPDLDTTSNNKIAYCFPEFGYKYDKYGIENTYIGEKEYKPPPDDDDIYDLTYYRIGIIEKWE